MGLDTEQVDRSTPPGYWYASSGPDIAYQWTEAILARVSGGYAMASVEVSQVIGSGSAQELICQFIALPAAAEEIKEIRKTVIIDNCMPVFNKVIIDGRLRKDIMFKAAAAGFPLPGNVQACVGTTTTITGTLADIDVDIAFNMVVPVPGAQPGDRCVVLQAFVEGEKEEAGNIQANGTFLTLIDKSIVFVCLKASDSKSGRREAGARLA